jgi:hypothetical protein
MINYGSGRIFAGHMVLLIFVARPDVALCEHRVTEPVPRPKIGRVRLGHTAGHHVRGHPSDLEVGEANHASKSPDMGIPDNTRAIRAATVLERGAG